MSFTQNLPDDLGEQIRHIIANCPESEPVFSRLYSYFTEDDNKRRKVATATIKQEHEEIVQLTAIDADSVIFQLTDLSFQCPVRKKLSLVIAILPSTQKPYIALTKSLADTPELIITDLSNENFKLVTLLPVPEKSNNLTLVFFYNHNNGNKFKNEPIVVNLNVDIIKKQLADKLANTDLIVFLQRQFFICKFKLTNVLKEIFYFEAYKGSKEGVLFFLPNYIIYGFKKPILLFAANQVDSIQYSSITRVTFNITVFLKDGEKFEFSMIDQSHFDRIDTYIKSRNVNDNSMSEELKAKTVTKQPVLGELEEANGLLGEQDPADSDDEDEDATFQAGEESGEEGGSGSGSGSDDGSGDDDDSDSDDDEDLSESLGEESGDDSREEDE